MKQRFSSLDVRVIAHELSNALLSLRVSNIYDLSSKIFLIKFAKPENKQQIIIDSGFRCHLTEYARATAADQSDFVKKLRKVLKTRRVTAVSQVGTDRIIEFQFSDGLYKLYLEFYAAGNILLTDRELKILALLRVVPEGEGQEELRVGLNYSLVNRQNYAGIPALTRERLQNALQKAADRGDDALVAGKKPKKKGADALRKALAVAITEFPPMLVDHAMRVTSFDSTLKPADVLQNEALLDNLMKSLQEAQRVIEEIVSSDVAKGYIIAKKKPGYEEGSEENARKGILYDDFHPFRPAQFEGDPATTFLEFEGFNKTVDEFFSSIEGQKLESRLEERELNAKRKIEAARHDQAKRLDGLQEVQTLNERKASAIEANVERVQEAMDAVNGLIAKGVDWRHIAKRIEHEQKYDNPVACMIKLPLKLHENTVTMLLSEAVYDEDGDSAYETDEDGADSEAENSKGKRATQNHVDRRLEIDIYLAISPWSNARDYFEQRRSAVTKEQKTLESSTKALKAQETKIAQDLKKGLKQEKATLRPVRRQMWFEKFIWFISSDGYLVLGGKDTQQNEMIYKRHMKKGDAYLHAEIQGAAVVVVRNNPKTPNAPIPPSTLSQAGSLVICCSNAWDSKAGMSAWWAYATQVSKSAPSGDFLPPGSFSVSGKKNFLPPAQLLLGFGIIFRISEESKSNHLKHRVGGDTKTRSLADHAQGESSTLLTESQTIHEDAVSEIDDSEDSDDSEGPDSDDEGPVATSNPLENAGDAHVVGEDEDEDVLSREVGELKVDGLVNTVDFVNVADDPVESDEESEAATDALPSGVLTPSQQAGKQSGPPPKRGKKGKAKKMANKYKDQDEEDRIAAQQLIGASTGLQKARAEAEAKAKHEAGLAFQKERRRAQHQRTQQETAEHERLRRERLVKGTHDIDEGEEEKMELLDALVGTPWRGDEILEAIPICAPWNAMGKFKYKAKIQPGMQKKGKATKEIIARWLDASKSKGVVDEKSEDVESMWPREVELLKDWKAEEVTNTIPVSKVRVMMAGGSSAAATGKGTQGKAKGKGRSGKGSKKSR